jgi:vancomycin resistance protein YoaR
LFVLQLPGGTQEQLAYGELGVEIDKERLGQLLRDTVDSTSPLSRVRRRLGLSGELKLPAPLRINRGRALPTLLRLKDEFDQTPIDARLDLAERKVIPSRTGLLLDIDRSLLKLEQAIASGAESSELVFEELLPARRTEELTHVRFDHVLSSFETHYDRSQKSAARTFNLRLAASRFDGYVLLPGEVFDFNRVVGPRDEANGYKVATVIAQGELVDGIGGGTCQVSGTLHGAAFFAGLAVVERYPHTRPSSYIKLGLDATVVYPTINYRIKNPFDYPVVLHETVKDGVVRAEVLGPPTEKTVTLIRRIDEALPYTEVERPEPSLARGERVLAQRGVAGFKVKLYRIIRNSEHAVRERWDSVYPPTTQVVRVGTGGAQPAAKPRQDPQPEYVADELLVVTLAREAGQQTAQFSESREPGRFGRPGWTEEAGMPFFKKD